ncbi:SusC/RagA family TonB-linked outer membrane protein [Saccharicrinis sp. FJH54]|uniref:SusC/RagA family TonB-linked outer membrane protein n=1 Tax=Saccharicrinis sp. FJH54 TaxID=3344665 RepID=UPI0035D4DB4B
MKNSTFFKLKDIWTDLFPYQLSKMFVAFFLLFVVGFASFAQQTGQISISGDITDEDGEPLIGVNILILNKARGAITDFNGHYSIQANASDTLQVTFIGYVKKVVPVNGRTVIDITLENDNVNLQEVEVVVGYGTVKRANLVGAVSSMTTAEIEDIPATSLTNLLEGRMAGVFVSPAQPTGNPGAQTRVRIRAETTFGTSGGGAKDPSPLYIVDGFEMSQEAFDMLDPSEIQSISVLKDASAAVYGSKGANGVVLVKTKRGRKGKLKVNYSGSQGIMDATQLTEMLSTYDLFKSVDAIQSVRNPGSWVPISDEELSALSSINYDWLGGVWQPSSISRHTINISGGNDVFTYYAGGTYVYTEGNFPDLGVGKYTYRIGLDANITDNLTASVTLALDNRDFKRPYLSGVGNNTMEGLFLELLQAPPWMPPYMDGKPVNNNLDFNPYALFDTKSFKEDVDKGNTLNLRLEYKFKKLDGLVATATYSRRENHSYSKQYSVPYTLYEFQVLDGRYMLSDVVLDEKTITNNDRISESYSFGQNYQFNFSLNYKKKFGLHDITSFFTYEQTEGSVYGFSAVAQGLQFYGVETQRAFNRLAAVSDGNMGESGDLGAVFRLNYSYANKYLFESTLRYDVSTLFAPGERAGLFPAFAVGWVLSEEDFIKTKLRFVDFLKIRYSYGLTGYPSVGPYEYKLSYGPSGSYLFGSGTAIAGMDVAGKTDVISSGVSWEKSQMQNVGIDLKFLNNRLSITADGYYTYQYDILDQTTTTLPETSGIGDMPSQNLGRLEAWGYDMSIGYRGRVGADFSWNINAIFSFNSNRILERPTQYASNDFRYPIGQATFAAGREEGFLNNGIIRTQEQMDAINAEWNAKWGHDYYGMNGTPGSPSSGLGSFYFQDIGRPGDPSLGEPQIVYEPDGWINEAYDRTYVERVNDHFVLKNLLPTFVTMGAGWRQLKMSMNWGLAYGITNKVVDKAARKAPTSPYENAPSFWKDIWTPDNISAEYPNPAYDSENSLVSTFWMKDVYQLRLKTLNISYEMPKKLADKYKIPQFRVFFVGTNLWTPVSTFSYKEDAIARFNTYPYLKKFNLGLSFSF